MSFHKSPLQILQSLTQKKFIEPKKEKSVFAAASEIYTNKKDKSSTITTELSSVKKTTVAIYPKNATIDANNGFVSQLDTRTKSPIRVKKNNLTKNNTDLDKAQIIYGEKPYNSIKTSVKDLISVNQGDLSIAEKKLSELDINELVKLKLELAYNDYQQEDYTSALIKLLKAEEFVERSLSSQGQLSFSTIFLVFYNMISTQYKLRALGDCKTYINHCLLNCQIYKEQEASKGSLFNFKSIQEQSEYFKYIAKKSLQKKYRCKMHLQACLIHSEIENHIEAYAHAKQATKLACHLLTDTLMIAYYLYIRIKETKQESLNNDNTSKESLASLFVSLKSQPESQAKGILQSSKSTLSQINLAQPNQQGYQTESEKDSKVNQFEDQEKHLENIIPILEEVVYKIKGKISFTGENESNNRSTKKKMFMLLRKQMFYYELNKIDMNKLYGSISENHFLYNLNIMGVAQIHPVNPSKFNENWTVADCIKTDTIIDQLLLLVVSLYALSTELRFWDEVIKRETPQNIPTFELMSEYLPLSFLKRESQLWIGRSLEFAFTYLPHNCPISEQIFSIYSKLYSPTKFMIPEEEEINQNVKYLVPAKGITKSTYFFIPLIKKSENEEDDGVATLLFTEKELDNSLSKAIKQIKLYDPRSKYYEALMRNYRSLQIRRNSRDTQLNFIKSTKITRFVDKNQATKGLHIRKAYVSKSPLKEERIDISGSGFSTLEDKDQSSLIRENSSFISKQQLIKKNPDSPQHFPSNRPSSKGGINQNEPKSPLRKSKDKMESTFLDPNKKINMSETILKEEKQKTLIENYNLTKGIFRPSSSGLSKSSNDNTNKPSGNSETKINKGSLFSVLYNQEGSTLEDTSVLKDNTTYQSNKIPLVETSNSTQIKQKKLIRELPDGKLRVMYRRVVGNVNKDYFSQSEISKFESVGLSQDSTSLEKGPFDNSTSVIMTEPNERSNSQENNTKVFKKNKIPEKGPIRAVTSLRTRAKNDLRSCQTEGDEETNTAGMGLEIYKLDNAEPRVINQSLELIKALKKRSSSNGRKPTNKTTIVTIKKRKE